jgi:hypothetical protein
MPPPRNDAEVPPLWTDLDDPRAGPYAERKDGGVSAATLAWVLDDVRIGTAANPPRVSAAELEHFRGELVQRLRRSSFPPA